MDTESDDHREDARVAGAFRIRRMLKSSVRALGPSIRLTCDAVAATRSFFRRLATRHAVALSSGAVFFWPLANTAP